MNNNIVIYSDDFKLRYESFKNFYNLKQLPNCPDLSKFSNVEEMLNSLADFILNDLATVVVYHSLGQIFIEIVMKLINDPTIESKHIGKNIVPGSLILNAIAKMINISSELSTILEYFVEKQQFFQTMGSMLRYIDQMNLQAILLAFYRLVTNDRDKFRDFVLPEVLYSILENPDISPVNKYLSIQLLYSCLELAESVKVEMVEKHLKTMSLIGYHEGDFAVDYNFLPLLEAQRLSNFSRLPKYTQKMTGVQFVIKQEDLSSNVVSICGVLIPTLNSSESQLSSIVPISKTSGALKQLAENIQKSKPTMLVGKTGSGKTFIINEIAKLLRKDTKNSIIKIHLNDQTDAKILLGTYTSDTKPGTFIWKNGVLTTAVKEGKWVLIEDIDKAPTEVLSILLTLLEKKELTIPSRGEVIKAANGFQLISTVRLSNDAKDSGVHDMIGMRMWNQVNIPELDRSDLMSILKFKFPSLNSFLEKFTKVFENVSEIYNSKKFITLNKGSQPRPISVRDFVKFCGRVNKILMNNGISSVGQMINSDIYDMIFQEASDCFTSSIVEEAPLKLLINEIGQLLEVPTSRIQLFLNRNVPVFEDFSDSLRIGRAYLKKSNLALINRSVNTTSFAKTSHALRLMEQIGVSISMCEPILLVGETGTGKTTVVQQVAKMLHKKLTVINVSQQTEIGDLLGGYKPVNTKVIALPIQESFEELFNKTFSLKKNAKFMGVLSKCFNKNQWKNVARLWKEAYKMSANHLNKVPEVEDGENAPKKKRRLNMEDKAKLMAEWESFYIVIDNFEKQSMNIDNAFAFQFVEGSLVKAVRNGDWLLLDEINLATPETLETIADLLSEEIDQRNLLLSEKGDIESVRANKDFRFFGCMNPSTDVGKRELPVSIRSRFTEIYVHSPDKDITDLLMIIDKYVGKFAVGDEWCGNDIAQLYLEAKNLADSNKIVDGANQKPHFSIRTLTRTLIYVCDIVSIYGLRRSLYEGFCMSFLTLLDAKSEELLKPLIEKYTIARLKNARSVMKQIPQDPSGHDKKFVQFRHYWMKHGPMELNPQPHYIITPFVEKNMLNLVRATSGRRFPVLIQGPTSSGKTSMIHYLANITGHKFVRINNHEHTDLQEYLGTYISNETGKLVFKEGILIEALRKGYWIVLDELNLAPTDVLEALNRLLDDNRELFIPETQELVHPHPDFMLFATQNPPGLYGGRKILSRAFRNRFLELHFDDIPQDELETILKERCQIAPTYGKKIVEVYRQLSIQRQATRFMEQGNSFATLRDLFRWAQREAVGYEQLAANGYMLLAERVRRPDEKIVVKQIIEKVMKVKLDMSSYYQNLENKDLMKVKSTIVWTKAMRRLSVLVEQAVQYNEPILLVGETGCGKTTICQLIAEFTGRNLILVNVHQNTETGDLLGAQRPLRNRSGLQSTIVLKIHKVFERMEIPLIEGESFEDLCQRFDSISNFENSSSEQLLEIKDLRQHANILFEWSDGPLVHAMKEGQFFLLDEISLADDSVLERLNSVLEPERSLLLAEKGTDDAFITAKEGFKFLATMNPGGDYGKKELSPALRNRFTEIWVPSMDDFDDVRQIVNSTLQDDLKGLTEPLVLFSEWFGKKFGGGNATNGVISLRDILAWVKFINTSYLKLKNPLASLLHGASMVFIDALGTNNTAFLAENESRLNDQKNECVLFLSKLVDYDLKKFYLDNFEVVLSPQSLKCGLFEIPRVTVHSNASLFNLHAPTTAANAMRVIRAMQVHKPILLEGSPGVGKTSLISALADATGNHLTRINLSEQTDLIDLFGSDAPAEGGETGEFVWRDAPFLRAMQRGEWVLLDEMNLANQSVLEGLNASLDHRGEAYIPELDKSFYCHPNFLVFAAQNPHYQGGGRKGLPKSFVNRFSVVYVDMLKSEDLNMIAHHLYPNIDSNICSNLITFISRLEEQVVIQKTWGSSGSPWEFNLRDTLRWLDLLNSEYISGQSQPVDFFEIIIGQRFRSSFDKQSAKKLFFEVFGEFSPPKFSYILGQNFLQAGHSIILREDLIQYTTGKHLFPLGCLNQALETILTCVNHSWPLILTGPSGSGKTELVRFVASIVGAKVDEFSMNSEVDSMDILGGYEQVDLTRAIIALSERLKIVLLDLIAINLKAIKSEPVVISQALQLLSFINHQNPLIGAFAELRSRICSFNTFLSGNNTFTQILLEADEISSKIEQDASVKFEWFDGLLVQAVEKGNWLVLDNANLCSPSVLDRLNSLLEPNGSLIINECSDSKGQPRIVKPHPNFRLFLTVDPKYGELSRAMRNRGIEMYLEKLESSSTSTFDQDMLGIYERPPKNEDDIENSLSLLALGDESVKPLSTFLACSESYLRPFFVISDVIMRCADATEKELSNILTENLTFASRRFISNWIHSVSNSSEFSNKFKAVSNEIFNQLTQLEKSGLIGRLVNLQKSYSIPAKFEQYNQEFISFQSFNPLFNDYLIPKLSKNEKFINSPEPFYLFKTTFANAEAAIYLEKLESKSLNGKLSELSYIEKSAAITLGRSIKGGPKMNIYTFVKVLSGFIENSILWSTKREELFKFKAFFEQLFELHIIWENLLNCSQSRNEAKLRVYQQLIETWILKNKDNGFEAIAVENLESAATSFNTNLKLTSGSSILLIWEHFKNQYPISEEGWQNRDALKDLAKEFDLVVRDQFPENYGTINELRSIILQLYKENLLEHQEGFQSIFNNISEGVTKLKSISSRFLNKRLHHFLNEFDLLLNFAESRSLYNKNADYLTENYLSLFTLAGKPTLLLPHTEISIFKPYPKIFDYVWGASDKSSVKGLFSNELILNIIASCVNFTKLGGSEVNQSMSDLSTLGSALLHNSNAVLADQLPIFKRLMKDWYMEMASIHLDGTDYIMLKELMSDLSISYQRLGGLLALVQLSVSVDFINATNNFFLPALLLISEEDADCKELGLAWILFSSGCLQLFVPSSPLDPAISEYVLFDINNTKIEFLDSFTKAWAEFVDVSNTVVDQLPHNVETQLSKPRAFRPPESCDPLFDTWNAFMNSTIGHEAIQRLTELASEFNLKASQQVDLFQKNSSLFLLRISTLFSRYADLNDILKGFILGLKIGFELLTFGKQKEQDQTKLVSNWSVDIIEISSPAGTKKLFTKALDFCKLQTANDLIAEKVFTYFMRLFFIHSKDSVKNNDNMSDMIHQVFQGLYYRWTLRRMKQEEEEAANSSLYRHNDFSADLEEDFKSIFPDFEEIMNFETSVEISNESVEDIYYDISKLYEQAFSTENTNNIEDLLTNGVELSAAMSRISNNLALGVIDPTQLTVIISQISHSLKQFQCPTEKLDFYKGFSPVETKRMIGIIERIQGSTQSLLQQWPEHATLQRIFISSAELLTFPSETPVAKLLAKVEQIYTFIAEWEKYAHSKVSLKNEFDQLTNLIISWRKLELLSWKSLFEFEEKTLQRSSGKWWFYLFETIIIPLSNLDDSIDEVQLLNAINIFLSQTTHGEFGYRLALLSSFREHLKSFYKGNSLLNAISNIITFYEQFKAPIELHIASKKKTLELSISEIILLASWKDVNIDALKQSARRSHQSLYKIVRKYRAVLAEPISLLIEEGVPFSSKEVVPMFSSLRTSATLSDLSQVSDSAISIFPVKRNFITIERKMKEYVESFHVEEIPSIYEFSKDLCEAMDELKAETPTKFTEESKKEVAALKTRKRKLFSDTLKELRRIGLKTQLSAEVLKLQSSINLLLAGTETFEGTPLEGSDSYFFRILDLMPRLRASVSNCAEDVPVSDAQKGLSVAEHLLSSLIAARRPLLRLTDFYSHADSIFESFKYLSSEKSLVDISEKGIFEIKIQSFRHICFWLPKICDHLIFTAKSAEELSHTPVSAEIFIMAKMTAEQFLAKLGKLSHYGLSTMGELQILSDFETFLSSLRSDLQTWKQRNEKMSFVAEVLIQWINSTENSVEGNSSSALTANSDLIQLETAFKNLMTSIIVSIQKTVQLQKSSELNFEVDNSFSITQQKLLKYSQLLFSRRITSRLEECLNLTSMIKQDEQTMRHASSYYYAALPFINHYRDLLGSLLDKYRANFVENSHGTFMMSVALYNLTQHGFCSPEKSEDQSNSENMKDGTGLGDGEGAQNNSNDVEDDEDLSEYAQQPNDEQKEKSETEENDDAVDIEGDMAGNLEEAEDQNSDEEAESDDENLDEEIDDIDDLDPNAIDDKMWDEEAQDTSKEKESETMPDNSNENDDMKANEEDDEKEESKDQKQSDDKQASEEQDNGDSERENDKDAEDEEDIGEQDDEVKNAEDNQLDPNTEEVETLELPENMNLDSGAEEDEEDESNEDVDDNIQDEMDVDFNTDAEEEKETDEAGNESDLEVNEAEDQENFDEEIAESNGLGDEPEKDEDASDEVEDAESLQKSSEEELDENKDSKKDINNPDTNDPNIEGVDGYEEGGDDDSMDIENMAKQSSGQQGEGTEAEANDEQQDVGSSGDAQQQQQQDDTESSSTHDAAREEATESLKELGDALKEFHRRHQEIIELKQDDMIEQSAAERPDEFQHLDGENSALETQALGAATKDQIQSINDDLAIDDEEQVDEVLKEEDETDDVIIKEEASEENTEKQISQDTEGDFNGQSKTAIIGERKSEDGLESELFNKALEDDMVVDEEETLKATILSENYEELPKSIEEARDLWRKSDIATQELSAGLCEQLRLILEPTLATKLKGDYKTGKRLNMKRIIPYIASEFRKDKIWLRRTKPSKRQYQIMIAVDDSKSMAESKAVELAFESIALVSKALTQLESGGLSIVKFGEETQVVHPFDKPFTSESGAKVFQWFDFKQTKTDIKKLCNASLNLFNEARTSGNSDLWQLEIIISDGVCEDHDTIQRLVRKAREDKIMLVFVIIDGINSNESILDMSQISYVPDENGKLVLKVDKYLDTFPFEFYVVVHSVSELPEMLSVILRQYFSELASA